MKLRNPHHSPLPPRRPNVKRTTAQRVRKKLADDKSTIFILTLVPIHKKDRHLQFSTGQGWYPTLEAAEAALQLCISSDFGYYNFVVIEEYKSGSTFPIGWERKDNGQRWYKWNGTSSCDTGKFMPCKCPKEYAHVVGIGLS